MLRPFNGTDFPTWKAKVQDVLSFLKLDYVLHEAAPVAPIAGIMDYDEKMYEYHFKLEEWEKSNKLAKKIIKRSISVEIREAFPDDEDKTAKEFLELTEQKYKEVCVNFLIKRLTTSRYDENSGLGNHIRYMWDIVYELKAFGISVSDTCAEYCIMESVRDI
ncbi:hypothetical protein ACP70R_001449 [Stipagrostis hirtigluma subsp. patula]